MNSIVVTQGQTNSIGLEVFLKSFLLLNKKERARIKLVCNEHYLQENFKLLNLQDLDLNIIPIKDNNNTDVHNSLEKAFEILAEKDVLLTLPSSKQEIGEVNTFYSGHTDYLRKKFNKPSATMLFASESFNLALLTEHISISEIEDVIDVNYICKKIETLIESHFNFKRYIFSGVNPHCGEDGNIGKSDINVEEAIDLLSRKFPDLIFEGPYSGDTLFCNTGVYNKHDCLIVPGHDQGLAPFKAISGFRATNITVGLPFVRLSPDHGTATEIYGKDKANYNGMLFTIKKALELVG